LIILGEMKTYDYWLLINVFDNNSKDINCEIILILPNMVCLLHPEKAVNVVEGVLNEERKRTKNEPI